MRSELQEKLDQICREWIEESRRSRMRDFSLTFSLWERARVRESRAKRNKSRLA